MFFDPYQNLSALQQSLDSFLQSNWLQSSVSAGGAFPPINVFRKGDDFMIIAELPGVESSNIDVQVKKNAIRISGTKRVEYDKSASIHRRERLSGRFDRTIALPVEIDADQVKAECRNGILGVLLPRAEQDKPKSIKISVS
jgi:HSP20 family protein